MPRTSRRSTIGYGFAVLCRWFEVKGYLTVTKRKDTVQIVSTSYDDEFKDTWRQLDDTARQYRRSWSGDEGRGDRGRERDREDDRDRDHDRDRNRQRGMNREVSGW